MTENATITSFAPQMKAPTIDAGLRRIGVRLCFAFIAMAMLLPAASFSPVSGQSLEEVLEAARRDRQQVSSENAARERRFRAERDSQQRALAEIRVEVNAAKETSDRLEASKDAKETEIEDLQATLSERQGAFGELFGAARSAADDLAAKLGNSIVSSQYSGREEPLLEMAQSESLPTIDQFEYLWLTLLGETVNGGETVTYNADVISTDNIPQQRSITRVGPFIAFSGDEFLVYRNAGDEGKKLSVLARQPNSTKRAAAGAVSDATGGSGLVRGIVDPSLGTLLDIEVSKPNLQETIAQGKFVGQIIIWVAVIAAIVGIVKILLLGMTGFAVAGQARSGTGGKGNPLARVISTYESNRDADVETLSLKLDDAILRELPRLNSFVDLIKVVASVAPLLGLLGTVIGMINTFQAITLFGTGDPQIMAGGISEALVTTVLGLCAAIPLLIIHAFASGLSRWISEILESQSAGMIAERAEREKTAAA